MYKRLLGARLHNMRLLALILIVALSTVASAQSVRRCVAGPHTVEASAHAPLRAGRYRLEIVATRGSRSGRRSVGALELRVARAADRSRAHPAERAPTDTASAPLVGSTDVNLRTVGAPLAASSDGGVPAPGSRDPLHPGVLMYVGRPAAGQSTSPAMLLIGTLWNRRVDDGLMGLDGPGIHLSIQRQRSDTAWGSWGAFGRLSDGSGYFCLVRIAD